jgi:methionine aminotransferase
MPVPFKSKLPDTGTTIFTVMSAMAREYGAINLSQGFPNFDVDGRLKDLVSECVQAGFNQYAPLAGVPELLHVLASKIRLLYNAGIDGDREITITAGATQAIFTAIASVVHPGDEVVIFDPSYDSYTPSVKAFGGIPVPVVLHPPSFRVDWDEVRQVVTGKTRLIIINSPHNPAGKVFREEDIEALREIVAAHPVFLLSDEVYEHLVFDGLPHLSILTYPDLYARAFVVFSFGKTLHATGWKLGYCVAPPALTAEFRKIHQFNIFCVNRPIQHAIAAFFEDPETYLSIPAFYQEKRDLFARLMENTRFRMIRSEGSYFMLADYAEISQKDDMAFTRDLVREHGVAAIPLSPFYARPPAGQHVIRFCFAKTDDLLEKAAGILSEI